MRTELRQLLVSLTALIYLWADLLVLGVSLWMAQLVAQHWVLHTLFRKGDLDLAAACLSAGALIFPAATLVLRKLNGLFQPWWVDHLRQCAGVYLVLVGSTAYLIGAYADHRDGLGYGVVAGAFVVSVYAVVVNGLVLWGSGRGGVHDPMRPQSAPGASPTAVRARSR